MARQGLNGRASTNDPTRVRRQGQLDTTDLGYQGGVELVNGNLFVRIDGETITYDERTRSYSAVFLGVEGLKPLRDLGDSSSLSAAQHLEAAPDPADTPATVDALRDDLVANTLPALRRNQSVLAAKLNQIIEALTR